ncbi:MAG: hypothetical protein L0H10_25760 [Comamonas sp.]|uniref:hypothetical protein n=1 Tax=Comamonas sp. TaxID=34028 RepID=UPI00264A33D5|nr:hypothetical protein [Comamonas sp.]MDN5507194.1 hypothetical protein [Comamonas sp.]
MLCDFSVDDCYACTALDFQLRCYKMLTFFRVVDVDQEGRGVSEQLGATSQELNAKPSVVGLLKLWLLIYRKNSLTRCRSLGGFGSPHQGRCFQNRRDYSVKPVGVFTTNVEVSVVAICMKFRLIQFTNARAFQGLTEPIPQDMDTRVVLWTVVEIYRDRRANSGLCAGSQ